MHGRRSLAAALVLIVTMLTGGAALAAGRVGPDRPQGPQGGAEGPAPSSAPLEATQGAGSRETIRLYGLQELDEISYITVDGRVLPPDAPNPFQFPGTAFLTAELSGENEVDEDGTPGAGDPDGTGTAHVELFIDPPEVCATLTVEGIGLPSTGAHIHEGEAGVNGPVVVSLPTPGEDGTAEGCVTEGVTGELLAEIAADPAGYYVNVHNATYPAGAVRGQLAQDPEAVIPMPGDRTVFRERLFRLDDSDPDNPRPRGKQLGTVVAGCTQATVGEAPEDFSWTCSRVLVLDGRGEITTEESYTYADPLDDTLSITGGNGRFRDAGGEVGLQLTSTEGGFAINPVYTIRLLHLR